MKIIIKTGLCFLMFMCLATSAKAFVFTDVPAHLQRANSEIKRIKEWAETTSHYKQMVGHIQEFQKYQNQFDGYWGTFSRVYSRVKSGDYASAFDVTKWDWKRLDDHILRTWRTWNQAWWDAQKLTLMSSELVRQNPAYRKYADDLTSLMDKAGQRIKINEATLNDVKKRNKESRDTLDELKAQNKVLTVENGTSGTSSKSETLDAGKLQSLNNLIMLEQAAIAAQEAEMKHLERAQEEELKNLKAELSYMEQELRENAMAEGWGFTLDFMRQ